MGEFLGEERAQASVEMAIVVPVLLVLALITYNLMQFLAATARFDRIAPDIVLAHGVSPASEDGQAGMAASACEEIDRQLTLAMEGYDGEVDVSYEQGANGRGEDSMLSLVGALRTYRCAFTYEPWPRSFSIAGVSLGAPALLRHERAVIVDPWRPGVVA